MSTTEKTHPEFSIVLEIKSNGSRLVSGWTTFLFVLQGQEFIPYLVNDRSTPRGCLKIAGCQAAKLPKEVSDGKKFAFKLASDTSAYVFNAPNELARERVITLLNFAAAFPDWFNPYSLTATLDLSEDMEEVSRVFFSSVHAKVAAKRLQSFFFYVQARKRVSRLISQYPEIYLVSVNKVENVNDHGELFAYVSGLVVSPNSEKDIFDQPHKRTVPVSLSKTPTISKDQSFHVAIAAHSVALSYLSVSLFPVCQKDAPQQESLGIAFLPLSDVPRRKFQSVYVPYTATLPLEPYLVPDLTHVSNPKPLGTGPTAPPTGPLTVNGHHHNLADDNHSVVSALTQEQDLASVSVGGAGTTATVNAGHNGGNVDSNAHGNSGVDGAAQASATTSATVLRGASLPNAVSGNLEVTVYTPPPSYTMCGWLLKKSDSWVIGGSYRPYWFVLMNGELQYFQQPPKANSLSLDQPKKLILCQNITAVTNKNGVVTVNFKQQGVKGMWQLKSDPHHAPATQTPVTSISRSARPLPPLTAAMLLNTWARKIVRCSSNLPDPALQAAANKGLFPEAKVATRSVSAKTHMEDGIPNKLVRAFSKERRASSLRLGNGVVA